MKTHLKTSLALGLILILNGGAFSAYAASAPDKMTPPARHLHLKDSFAKAKALAPAAVPQAPAPRVPETDGLSRNDEDCNYGCIDH